MVHAYCDCGAYIPPESIVLLDDGSYSWVCHECGEAADHVFPEECD